MKVSCMQRKKLAHKNEAAQNGIRKQLLLELKRNFKCKFAFFDKAWVEIRDMTEWASK